MKANNMNSIKFDSRVFESDKELKAYKLGYQDAMEEVDTNYSDEDIEIAEERGYLRGYKEATEEREDHPESNRMVATLTKALGLKGGHWSYITEKAILSGDEKALIILMIELEKRYE